MRQYVSRETYCRTFWYNDENSEEKPRERHASMNARKALTSVQTWGRSHLACNYSNEPWASGSRTAFAHCRGVRRIHSLWNSSNSVQAPYRTIPKRMCMAHCFAQIRMFGALRELVRAKQCVVFIKEYNQKQRGKAERASCLHERSWGLDERPNFRWFFSFSLPKKRWSLMI